MKFTKDLAIEYFNKGCRDTQSVGSEHEVFIYNKNTMKQVDYATLSLILKDFTYYGWQPQYDGDNIVGLYSACGNISTEPGCQIEFSANVAPNLNHISSCNIIYFDQLNKIAEHHNCAIIGMGVYPLSKEEDIAVIPKSRYKIMHNYMPKVGSKGRQMMKTTCTMQTNLDYQSEKSAAQIFSVSSKMMPIITALFANSPMYAGKNTNMHSYRMHIWEDVDNKRHLMSDDFINGSLSFEKYLDYAMNVPMYFYIRDNKYIENNHITFKEFVANNEATIDDFTTHLSTLFPDVRLKQYIEMRGADSASIALSMSLNAIFMGIAYNNESLQAAEELLSCINSRNLGDLKLEAIKHSLNGSLNGINIKKIASELLRISYKGLESRNQGEEVFLEPLIDNINKSVNPSALFLDSLTKMGVDEAIKAHSFSFD